MMLLSTLLVAFLLGEMLVRLSGHFDKDGNFFVGSFQGYPYRVPLHSWEKKIDEYREIKNGCVIYDPFLGWAPRPKSRSKSGFYLQNGDAIRTESCDSVVSKIPGAGVLRIAIFGDSFARGDDVPFKDTWGHLLENNLKKAGINAEVLNFAMGAYGTDQSFLRWRREGYAFESRMVILGLPLENINRNVNLARQFYFRNAGMPFLKPRFILEQNELKLINAPTPTPDKVMDIVRHFDDWEYSKYEYWYDKDKYQDGVFLNSKLISFCYSFIKEKRWKKRRADKKDLEALGLAIISRFKKEVEAQGKEFYVLFLPSRENLDSKEASFLKRVEGVARVVNPQDRLLEEAQRMGLQDLIPYHYSAKANEIVAGVLTDFILKRNQ